MNIDEQELLSGLIFYTQSSFSKVRSKKGFFCSMCGNEGVVYTENGVLFCPRRRSMNIYNSSLIPSRFSKCRNIRLDNGNWEVILPFTKLVIELKLLTGSDESRMLQRMKKNKAKQQDNLITDQMHMFIVSVNGDSDKYVINYLIDNMIAQESRYLRKVFSSITPDIKITGDFECPSCDYLQELEVPFGADFFWPDR